MFHLYNNLYNSLQSAQAIASSQASIAELNCLREIYLTMQLGWNPCAPIQRVEQYSALEGSLLIPLFPQRGTQSEAIAAYATCKRPKCRVEIATFFNG